MQHTTTEGATMPTPSLHHRPLACAPALLLAIAALCMAPLAGAKEKTPPKHKTKTHKVVKSPQAMDSGSAESRHDRERRLLRECKGRVNAGACAGYTG